MTIDGLEIGASQSTQLSLMKSINIDGQKETTEGVQLDELLPARTLFVVSVVKTLRNDYIDLDIDVEVAEPVNENETARV